MIESRTRIAAAIQFAARAPVSVLLLVLTVPSYCEGFEGDPDLLHLIASKNRMNVESIVTWSGRLDVTEEKVLKNGDRRDYKSRVEFAFDATLEATRWNWDCYDFSVTRPGGEPARTEVGLMSGMIKDAAFYRLGPTPASHSGRQVAVIHGESPFGFGPESVDFDPMYCFTDFGELLHKRFEAICKKAKNGHAQAWSVSREGDLVSVLARAEASQGTIVVNRYDIDISKGANVVRYMSSDNSGELSYEYDYQQVGGTWVPSRYEYRNDRFRNGATSHRIIQWVENRVNYPSDASLFTLASLGLSEGDRVKDSRSGTQFTIGGREAARKKAGFVDGPPAPLQRTYWLVAINVVVILGLLCLLLLRQRWRPHLT